MAHGAALRQVSGDARLAGQVMYDYTKADLAPQTRGMLDFAVKLTREPWAMERADVERLRSLGLSDEQVLSVVLITCQFNFMTRLADALGVDVSPDRVASIGQWLTGPAAQQEWLMKAKT
ncbi:MAG: peroxidase-related enzyme [Chloroflexi bacterium]|nr:peroxidase-related enzyme [Chloroflexota bacterium]